LESESESESESELELVFGGCGCGCGCGCGSGLVWFGLAWLSLVWLRLWLWLWLWLRRGLVKGFRGRRFNGWGCNRASQQCDRRLEVVRRLKRQARWAQQSGRSVVCEFQQSQKLYDFKFQKLQLSGFPKSTMSHDLKFA